MQSSSFRAKHALLVLLLVFCLISPAFASPAVLSDSQFNLHTDEPLVFGETSSLAGNLVTYFVYFIIFLLVLPILPLAVAIFALGTVISPVVAVVSFGGIMSAVVVMAVDDSDNCIAFTTLSPFVSAFGTAIIMILYFTGLAILSILCPIVLFAVLFLLLVCLTLLLIFGVTATCIKYVTKRYNEIMSCRSIAAMYASPDYVKAEEINSTMADHPALHNSAPNTKFNTDTHTARISAAAVLADTFQLYRAMIEFELKAGLTKATEIDRLCESLKHLKKRCARVANVIDEKTCYLQRVAASSTRSVAAQLVHPVDAAEFKLVTETAIQVIKNDTTYGQHPLAVRFAVFDSTKFDSVMSIRRAGRLLAGPVVEFEYSRRLDPVADIAACNALFAGIKGNPLKSMHLTAVVTRHAALKKYADTPIDDLIDQAKEEWKKTVLDLLYMLDNHEWTLSNRGEFITAVDKLLRMLTVDADLRDPALEESIAETAEEAVATRALLLSLPEDHEEEMIRIKKAIKRGKRDMFHAENPVAGEDAEDPVDVRARIRKLGREREQLMAGLAYLNGVGFVDAPVMPPLEDRCEGTMTLAMFEDVRPLAQSNATILAARYNGEAVVLKQYSGGDKKARKKMYNELRTLDGVKHPNVVKVHYAFEDQRMFYLVFDHFKYGNLVDWAQEADPTESDVLYAAKKTVEAVACLHSGNVIHCDIKPANVFVTATGNPVLGDFDVSRSTEGRTMTCTVAGALAYMAPELFRLNPTGVQPVQSAVTDVFSLGVTLAELVEGRTDRIDDIIEAMRSEDPEKRPALHTVLNHPAFIDADKARADSVAANLADIRRRRIMQTADEANAAAHNQDVTDEMQAQHEELEAEARRLEELREAKLCMVCKERKATNEFTNCGHMCLCSACTPPKRCPRCRKKSTKVCYAFKGALSNVTAAQFAMMGTAERAAVVRACIIANGHAGTMMTLHELLHEHSHFPFHELDNDLMLETLRHMERHAWAKLNPCKGDMGVKFAAIQ